MPRCAIGIKSDLFLRLSCQLSLYDNQDSVGGQHLLGAGVPAPGEHRAHPGTVGPLNTSLLVSVGTCGFVLPFF